MHSVTMFFSCLSYFWGNDGVIGAVEFLIYILYRETFKGENFHEFRGFVAIRSFLSEIL